MGTRRARGDDSIYFEHSAACRDDRQHRNCPGRWRGAISLGRSADGKTRIRRKVSGQTKTAVKDELDRIREETTEGVRTSGTHTLQRAVDAWLDDGMSGRSEQTVAKYRYVLKPVMSKIGGKVLRDLTAADVRNALRALAADHSTGTVSIARLSLERAIRHAEAAGLVRRNVASLVDAPEGQSGRPSKSLTPDQAEALVRAAYASRICSYILLSLLTGVRTEEARALLWDHVVAWVEDEDRWVPVSEAGWDQGKFAIYVWRSVRSSGDTKTDRSRRTLALPVLAAEALRLEWEMQQADRYMAGTSWQENGLVFCSSVGTKLDAANVRREFKAVCEAAGIGRDWTPRELRHTFVSLMSEGGMSTEEIARLVGHASTAVTERIYRKELRPVLQGGAEAMNRRFSR